ncbi:AAA family ATPase, partial [Streptomyces sp. NPDC002143]
MGKTVLMAGAAAHARSAGVRVLAATGRESEQCLAFAGLYQLLRPVLDRTDVMPVRQADALRGAFGISADPTPPDALLTGIAVLTQLSQLADEQPLLVWVDDAQWLDRASLDALAFAARRVASEPLVLLLSARGTVPPDGFERGFPQLQLAPLDLPDAGRLLDAQPRPPRGRPREQVLAQAAGNPLALIELAKVIAQDPDAGRRWVAEPLPLTTQLTTVMGAQFRALPQAARSALLIAAAADSPNVATAVPGLSATALAPAEAAGLIRLDAHGPQFTHPLARSAVYHAAPFTERSAAHRQVADALHDQPDRHAWHLAAAALGPDEEIAVLLETSAAQAQRRGGVAAAAAALERAGELSADESDKTRRLLAAADLAQSAGQADWVLALAENVLTLTSEPAPRIAARLGIGWALQWSNRHTEALETLLAVAAEAGTRLPEVAWSATSMAATIAHQTGTVDTVTRMRAALDALDRAAPAPEGSAREYRLWMKACMNPYDDRDEALVELWRLLDAPPVDPGLVGAAAWVLNETETAVGLMRESLTGLRAWGMRGASGGVLSALEWAYIDSGRWDEALAAAREANDIAAAYKMETVAGSADLTLATVAAMRGDLDNVGPLLTRVHAAVDAAEYNGFAARIRHAAGLAELARGNYIAAYAQLRRHFSDDGSALHHTFSYLAIADLAAAAARTERPLEARTLLERALTRISPRPGPRLDQLAARARGLLAASDTAEKYFATALADPVGEAWPFERAQLQLDFGAWLRRKRRINDAKPVLGAALETFCRLGASPWTRRAESELRACGVNVQAPRAVSALGELTAQQREIVVLAGSGLTNGEIADRLFLSPRTVASHLYRSYPKLGIAGRHQLRDLIDGHTGDG